MPEGEQLYPRPPRPKKDKSHRPWRVDYRLVYDGGGAAIWSGYYRTLTGAHIAAFWNYNMSSYGGSAILFDNRPQGKFL